MIIDPKLCLISQVLEAVCGYPKQCSMEEALVAVCEFCGNQPLYAVGYETTVMFEEGRDFSPICCSTSFEGCIDLLVDRTIDQHTGGLAAWNVQYQILQELKKNPAPSDGSYIKCMEHEGPLPGFCFITTITLARLQDSIAYRIRSAEEKSARGHRKFIEALETGGRGYDDY